MLAVPQIRAVSCAYNQNLVFKTISDRVEIGIRERIAKGVRETKCAAHAKDCEQHHNIKRKKEVLDFIFKKMNPQC